MEGSDFCDFGFPPFPEGFLDRIDHAETEIRLSVICQSAIKQETDRNEWPEYRFLNSGSTSGLDIGIDFFLLAPIFEIGLFP